MLTDSQRRELLAPAAYYYFLYLLPALDVRLAEAVMKSLSIDENDLHRLSIRAYPTRNQNLIFSHACSERFGDLSGVDGFYLCQGCWWLDLDERWTTNGFLMPVRDAQRLWFSGLMAFRYPGDKHPFPAKVRSERKAA
jgi:hypothetical protein